MYSRVVELNLGTNVEDLHFVFPPPPSEALGHYDTEIRYDTFLPCPFYFTASNNLSISKPC